MKGGRMMPSRGTRRTTISVMLLCIMLAACQKEDTAVRREKPVAVAPADAPTIRVHADETGHIYRYFPTGQRAAKTSMTLDGVPEQSRDLVLVIPEAGAPAGLAYVADLRTANEGGEYSYKVVHVQELDKALDESRGAAEAPDAAGNTSVASSVARDEVIMFSASWCGVCTQARRWFRNKGIEVVERDIEKDKNARTAMLDMAKKAGANGSQLNGVPIIFVNGQMFPGFDPYKIQAALKSAKSS